MQPINTSKRPDLDYLPTSYCVWGCSSYRVSEVKCFINEDACISPEDGDYYVSRYQVDEQGLIEYRKLQEAIEKASEPIKVRVKADYRSRTGKDWSNLSGELFGSTTLVMVEFGNSHQIKEIEHRNLILT